MSFSRTKIDVSTSDGHFFTLLEAVTYVAKSGDAYVIPAGTITDGVSSPRPLWPLVAPFGYPWLAAVLHDFLYVESVVPKRECDDLFLEAMLSLGVTRITAYSLYASVRWLGWRSFRRDRGRRT